MDFLQFFFAEIFAIFFPNLIMFFFAEIFAIFFSNLIMFYAKYGRRNVLILTAPAENAVYLDAKC